MTTDLRTAAQQALEALEWFNRYGSETHGPSLRGAESAIRAALTTKSTHSAEMNREEIIRMAGEAGFEFPADYDLTEATSRLERFAALIEASTKERCAELVETFDTTNPNMIAAAICARGE